MALRCTVRSGQFRTRRKLQTNWKSKDSRAASATRAVKLACCLNAEAIDDQSAGTIVLEDFVIGTLRTTTCKLRVNDGLLSDVDAADEPTTYEVPDVCLMVRASSQTFSHQTLKILQGPLQWIPAKN